MIVRPYHWYILGAVTFVAWTLLIFFALEMMVSYMQTR
jgi:hypothetical protein